MVLWFSTFDFSFSFLFIIYLSKALHSCVKEPRASAESSFRKENACVKVFLSGWKGHCCSGRGCQLESCVSVRAGWSSSASCPVIPAPTASFAWVVQLFTGSLVREVKKLNQSWKKWGGGIIFGLDQFPDHLYLPGLQMVEVARLRGGSGNAEMG